MLEIGFLLDDAPRLGRPVEVDSHEIETLIENKSVLSHAGDSQHTQNIQINKVIGENEKCVFYFMEKTIQTFWPTQYLSYLSIFCLSRRTQPYSFIVKNRGFGDRQPILGSNPPCAISSCLCGFRHDDDPLWKTGRVISSAPELRGGSCAMVQIQVGSGPSARHLLRGGVFPSGRLTASAVLLRRAVTYGGGTALFAT